MAFQDKINKNTTGGVVSPVNTFFSAASNSIQRQADLPGPDPEPARNIFVTPDSRGITNNIDNKISLDIHIDYLPSHTRLHVYTASQPGGDYRSGAPLSIIGDPGKGGNYAVTLSPVPKQFYIVFKAISQKTGISVPNITGTCSINLD
jgi:hypothetical protein